MNKNKKILLVIFVLLYQLHSNAAAGDTLTVEKGLKNRSDIIFTGSFDEDYNNNQWIKKWGIPWTARTDKNTLIKNTEHGGKALRVTYPKGGVGPDETGSQFPVVFNNTPQMNQGFYQEIYFRYYVKFEEGFDFRLGGKLPGLMGGGDSWTRSGGNQPDGSNGWTLRMMWRENGKLVVYAYVPPSKNQKYGSETWGQDIDCDFTAEPGQWICIEQFVNVGTQNKDDGQLKIWINGSLKIDIDDMHFRDVENTNGLIGGFYFSTFHGGNTDEWGPLNDSFAQFDNFVVAKNRVGCLK